METDRRGFFQKLFGASAALILGPKILPEVMTFRGKPINYDDVFSTTLQHYNKTIITNIEGPNRLFYLLRGKMREASIGIAEQMDKVMIRSPQLQLFPPHIPQVPLEDGWAAWEDAEQLPLFDISRDSDDGYLSAPEYDLTDDD